MSVTATPLRLDTTSCDRCGRCAPLCKLKALRIGPGYIFVDWDLCDGCGRCADACDQGAITLRRVSAAPAPAPLAAPVPVAASAPGPGGPAAPVARTRTKGDAGADVEWSLPEGGLVLVVAFLLLVGVQAAAGAIAGTALWPGTGLVAYDATLAAVLWYLARRRGAAPFAAYHLDVRPTLTSGLSALGVAMVCWLFSVSYRAAVLAMGLRPSGSEGSDLTGLFGPGTLGVVLTVAIVAVVGPALEEVLLRGVVMGAARRRIGTWPAILLSAAAFALLHASLWSLLPLAVLGVGLGWLASRSRSLWPAVVAHVLYNAVLVGAALATAAR
jgi:membrane protease YdiL (CAAX protease family)/Pyruvate/2-oxoacid:ferredoxin oxidoreductase delta subunit